MWSWIHARYSGIRRRYMRLRRILVRYIVSRCIAMYRACICAVSHFVACLHPAGCVYPGVCARESCIAQLYRVCIVMYPERILRNRGIHSRYMRDTFAILYSTAHVCGILYRRRIVRCILREIQYPGSIRRYMHDTCTMHHDTCTIHHDTCTIRFDRKQHQI